eukprot:5058030-Alexandrium_andersonii.AAC.1
MAGVCLGLLRGDGGGFRGRVVEFTTRALQAREEGRPELTTASNWMARASGWASHTHVASP